MKRMPTKPHDRRIRRPEPAAVTEARDAALEASMRLRGF
jgi:hypothetical protein